MTPAEALRDMVARFAGLGFGVGELRRGGDVVPNCLCAGIETRTQFDEMGRLLAASGTIRYQAESEPVQPIAEGDIISMTMPSGESGRLRVVGRSQVGDAVKLTVEAEHE